MSGSIQMLDTAFSSDQAEEKKLMRITLREIDRLNKEIASYQKELTKLHQLSFLSAWLAFLAIFLFVVWLILFVHSKRS